MIVEFKNILRTSQINESLKDYFNDCRDQALNPNSDVKFLKTNNGASNFRFANIDADTVSVDERLAFINSELVNISEFPIFIYCHKDLLNEEVFEGLHYRIDEEQNIRLFSEWAAENETNPIRETETHCLLRTAIQGVELDESELAILKALHYTTTGGQALDMSNVTVTGTSIVLWGMQEFKNHVSTYFPES